MAVIESSKVVSKMLMVKGRPQEVLVRVGNAPSRVFIDQLTFVFAVDAFIDNCLSYELDKKYMIRKHGVANFYDFFVVSIFERLSSIFGFDHYQKRDKGLNRYDYSYVMCAKGTTVTNYGTICIGGNKDTCCVVLTGMGLSVAKDGWEQRLYDFSQRIGKSFRLSRIDIARDFFNGEYNIDDAERDYHDNCYTLSAIRPVCDKQGYDWFNNNTKTGRTFYIGSRKNSSRLVRVYEKGKQLGDPESPWVRLEVSYRRRDLVLPPDMLLNPTAYVSEYPAIRDAINCHADDEPPKRLEVKRKQIQLAYERACVIYRHQCGRWINFLKGMGKTADEIVQDLVRHLTPDQVPKRLDPRCYFLAAR